jgi:chaperonin cofactor prefoldin
MKVHKDYRGEHDLEMRIEQLTNRVRDLEDINEGHRKLNQELRKELIEDLSNKLARKDS